MSSLREHSPEMPEPGYEKSDISVKGLFFVAAIVLLVIIFVVIAMNEIFIATKEKEFEQIVRRPESAELRTLRAREDEVLNSYNLLDTKNRIYQIPIDRAMQLLDEEDFEKRIAHANTMTSKVP